jgi:hypothetical protein
VKREDVKREDVKRDKTCTFAGKPQGNALAVLVQTVGALPYGYPACSGAAAVTFHVFTLSAVRYESTVE